MKAQGGVGSSEPRRPLRTRRRREAAPRPRRSALSLGLLVVLAVLTLLTAVAGLRPQAALATDPLPLLAVQQAELTATDGAANKLFGCSVALSGDTAVAGAPYHTVGSNDSQGAAYVFTRDRATGTWRQQAELTATGGAANDHFGCSVALSGGVAVVTSIDTQGGQGAAYVFARDRATGTWRQQGGALTAKGGGAEGAFGCSVALAGDTAVVGASFRTVGRNAQQGAAYVFARDRATGTWRQKGGALTAAHGAAGDHFGISVALSGDTAVVGAPYRTVGGNQWQGAAYVFARDRATGTWRQKGGALTAKGGDAGDTFGSSVDLAGKTAVVGAPSHREGRHAHQGAVYVFTRDRATGTWRQQGGALTVPHGAAGGFFGISVALAGGVAVVGASDSLGDQNAAYVFTRDRATGTWRQRGGALTPAGGAAVDDFGSSVALAGDTAVIGAPYRTVGSNDQQGAAYVFTSVGPPAVDVRSFAARMGSGGRVTLVWRTAAQGGLAGFFLGRRAADGHWRRVNRALLPATQGAAGATYRLADPAARAGRPATYRLREVFTGGGSRLCGPWTVTARR